MYVSLRWLPVDFPILESRAFRTIEVSKNDSSQYPSTRGTFLHAKRSQRQHRPWNPALPTRALPTECSHTGVPGPWAWRPRAHRWVLRRQSYKGPVLVSNQYPMLANVEEDSVLTNLAWSFSDPRPRPYLPLSTPLESKRSH